MQHVLQYYALSPRLVLKSLFPVHTFCKITCKVDDGYLYLIYARVHVLFYKKSVTHQPPSFSALFV